MTLYSVLPGAQHFIVIALFDINASLVLNFSKLGSTLLVHAVLEVTTHGTVALTYLSQDVSLVSLAV